MGVTVQELREIPMARSGARITPVLLVGGQGNRLWPLSSSERPKPFLALAGAETLLQQAALRVADPSRFARPIVVANAQHRFLVGEQLLEVGVSAALMLEPVGRNTAMAAAVAALLAAEDDPTSVLLLLPADHVIPAGDAFGEAVSAASEAAAAGRIVLLGVKPTRVETAYGYIRVGDALAAGSQARAIRRFVEKPPPEAAEKLVAAGDSLWNSGMFVCRADTLLGELAAYAPQVLDAARDALASGARDSDFVRLDAEAFVRSPSLSLDHAVMEHTKRGAVIEAAFAWTDVGAWSSLWELGPRDADGNLVVGSARVVDAKDCYIRSEGPVAAAVGVQDIIVVATDAAVLVAHRSAAQSVKALVEQLRSGTPADDREDLAPGEDISAASGHG